MSKRSKTKITRRQCRPVLVFDKQSRFVKEYENVKAASDDLGIKEYRVRNLIYEGKSRHGLRYQLGRHKPKLPPVTEERAHPGKQAWEGANGMFNIKGWAKMPLFA